jgi:hypothetical protein
MRRKVLKCSSCRRRVNRTSPHVRILDKITRRLTCYHARPECLLAGTLRTRALRGEDPRGRYVITYKHSRACTDGHTAKFECMGRCFVLAEASQEESA